MIKFHIKNQAYHLLRVCDRKRCVCYTAVLYYIGRSSLVR